MPDDFERRRILVVDDEERMVRFIRLNLEHDGFLVTEAFNGKQAIQRLRDATPDLILLDVMMPEVDENLKMDFDRREVWKDGKTVKLRPTEYRLLYHLVQNAGWVVSHDQLLAKVWGYEYRDEPHYVRLYINYLREKLEDDPSNPRYILTERGVGYRFVDFRRQREDA